MPRSSRPLHALRAAVSRLVPVTAVVALLVAPGHLAPDADGTVAMAAQTTTRPNVVLITTDDQRADDLRWMPFTKRLLGGNGVTFTDALSPHPLCCPARAEFVTGQYGQNNGVHHNVGVHGGYPALRDKANTLGSWLDAAGYQTAMVGKYMNGYEPDAASRAGWDHWNPSIFQTYSYNFTMFLNDGDRRRHLTHVDDVVTSYATDYIEEFSKKKAPFFVWASNLAPHVAIVGGRTRPPIAAPRHRGTLAGTPASSTTAPSFGQPVVDGPRPRLRATGLRTKMSTSHVQRIESLQAVDEGVRDIVRTLERTGELEDTYIVFTSDNGYLLGEHGLVAKNVLFEEALRVPLIVRVPGTATATTSAVPVTSVDLAPTIADLAGATPQRTVDGTSFAPLLSDPSGAWRDTQLIQTGTDDPAAGEPGWDLRGVRTDRYTYALASVDGAEQLYDRHLDPFQTVNVAQRPEYQAVLDELHRRTTVLGACTGTACSQQFGATPEPEPLLSPLPVPPAPPVATEQELPAPPLVQDPLEVRVSLKALTPRIRRGGTVPLVLRAPQRIRSVVWQTMTDVPEKRSGSRSGTPSATWRTLATSKGSGAKLVERVPTLPKPGKQRFRALVTLAHGRGTTNKVVVTVR
jgi:arylsulfatase A-like enzyme